MKLLKVLSVLILLSELTNNLFAASQIKVICDKDGQEVYLNGKFKAKCDSGEPVPMMVKAGKYTVEVKKDNGDGSYYYYKKSFRIGDGVQKIVEVSSNKNYTEERIIKVWEKIFGGSDWDVANSIIQTKNGGFIVAGLTFSKGAGSGDAWIIKIYIKEKNKRKEYKS